MFSLVQTRRKKWYGNYDDNNNENSKNIDHWNSLCYGPCILANTLWKIVLMDVFIQGKVVIYYTDTIIYILVWFLNILFVIDKTMLLAYYFFLLKSKCILCWNSVKLSAIASKRGSLAKEVQKDWRQFFQGSIFGCVFVTQL